MLFYIFVSKQRPSLLTQRGAIPSTIPKLTNDDDIINGIAAIIRCHNPALFNNFYLFRAGLHLFRVKLQNASHFV